MERLRVAFPIEVNFNETIYPGVPNVEMHSYARGGHGGSIGVRNGIPFGTWPQRFFERISDLGCLGEIGVETKAAQAVATFATQKPRRAKN